jgi:transposase
VSQIQALDRTQPGLPMKKGRAGTIIHDYKRHGITTLFAPLDVLEGKVIGQCMKRHRHQEFIRFLNVIDARVAKNKTVHVIVDNYAAHKHDKTSTRLAKISGSCWRRKRSPWRTGMPRSNRKPRI